MEKKKKKNQQQITKYEIKSNNISNVASKYKHIPMVLIIQIVWRGIVNY